MKRIFLLLVFAMVVNSCTNSTKDYSSNNCMEHSTLFFYSALRQDYVPLYENWKKNLTDTFSIQFCEDVHYLTEIIEYVTDRIFDQTGGIDVADYKLINPCAKNGEVIEELFENYDFRNKLELKMIEIKEKYKDNGLKETLELLEHLIKTGFTSDSAYFSRTHMESTSYSELVLELTIYEQSIYLFVQKSFNGPSL